MEPIFERMFRSREKSGATTMYEPTRSAVLMVRRGSTGYTRLPLSRWLRSLECLYGQNRARLVFQPGERLRCANFHQFGLTTNATIGFGF